MGELRCFCRGARGGDRRKEACQTSSAESRGSLPRTWNKPSVQGWEPRRDGIPAKGFEPVRATPPVEDVGAQRDFWTYDFAAKKNVKTTATLRLMTDHAKWWAANDANVDLGGLRTTASSFEGKIYPTDRRLYGEEWSPGIDGDPRINLVFARLPGSAAGYFSGSDEEEVVFGYFVDLVAPTWELSGAD